MKGLGQSTDVPEGLKVTPAVAWRANCRGENG